MADFTIYKHGHFTIFWSGLKFNDVTIDVANYSFVCKIRDRKKNTGKPGKQFIPGNVIELSIDDTAGNSDELNADMTSAQSGTLTATTNIVEDDLPIVDLKITRDSDGKVAFVRPTRTVAIVETASF